MKQIYVYDKNGSVALIKLYTYLICLSFTSSDFDFELCVYRSY